ncbi:MAG: zf-TFIIB domain-containing protein [Deltaproteobacteria bacterium]
MDCPRCSVEMTEIAGDDNVMQRCSDCGGLWVDVSDVNRFLVHGNLPALTSIGGWLNADVMAGQCPACNVDLVEIEGGEKKSLRYDTCESCGGIWIDGPEEGDVPETVSWKDAAAEIVGFYRRFARK